MKDKEDITVCRIEQAFKTAKGLIPLEESHPIYIKEEAQ